MDENKERVAIIRKTKCKIVGMNKRVFNTLYYVFFIAFIFLILLQWYWENNGKEQEAQVLRYVQLGLGGFALLFRFAPGLFPKWFADKKRERGL